MGIPKSELSSEGSAPHQSSIDPMEVGEGMPDDTRARAELILNHIETMPTLSHVAVRVLQLSSQPDADVREITRLIESDPSLSLKLLKLCRSAGRKTSNEITTIDRAVVMLGIETVRAAMLSVEVYGLIRGEDDEPSGSLESTGAEGGGKAWRSSFDRSAFWRHSLAVACAAELIAEKQSKKLGARPQEAFLCGLLHDLGKLALDRVLPRAFSRCVELSDQRNTDIAEVERRVIGLDHHTAGKRLAEHWGMPHAIQDVIWLHNQPAVSLPDVPHRTLIGIVTVAQALTRSLMIGWSGSHPSQGSIVDLANEQGLDGELCRDLESELFDRLAVRAAHLGLETERDHELLLASIAEANRRLGGLNDALQAQAARADRLSWSLNAIARFQEAAPSRASMSHTASVVIRGAQSAAPDTRATLLWQNRPGAPWKLFADGADGASAEILGTPPKGHDLTALTGKSVIGFDSVELLNWLSGHLSASGISALEASFVPLLDRGGPAAVLIVEGGAASDLLNAEESAALRLSWGNAIAGCAQHEGARRLGEQLADANRRLSETQGALVESRSLARLGELAAGAAHEMNNPLTVISGNAQVLATRLVDPDNQQRCLTIVDATQRLTDLISSLHLFADPPSPDRRKTSVEVMIREAVAAARSRFALAQCANPEGLVAENEASPLELEVSVMGELPEAFIDRGQIGQAVTELLVNAFEANPKRRVLVKAFAPVSDGRLIISVEDDGSGMSSKALAHACDPFFSEKGAGRQAGLGLARARRLIDLHGGELRLESVVDRGSTVTIVLPDWRWDAQRVRDGLAA